MIPHTGTILTPAPSNQHHRMLLHIMPLSRNITRYNPPGAKPHSCCFPFCRVRFLGFGDADFETDTFEFGGVDVAESWGDGFTCSLGDAASLLTDQNLRFNQVLGVRGSWGK